MASPSSSPSSPSSVSMSRSRSSRDDIRLVADTMLHSSLSHNPSSAASSVSGTSTQPNSMSRSRSWRDNIRLVADTMLRSSLSPNPSSAASSISSTSTLPGTPESATLSLPVSSHGSSIARNSEARIDTPAASMHLQRSRSSTATTTSGTRERLRAVEVERDELRRAVDGGTPAASMHLQRSRSSTAATTSRTRERLRAVEVERDELQRAVDGERAKASEMRRLAAEEHAIAERLKREGGASELSSTEARLRALELHRDLLAPSAQLMRRSSAGLFKATYSTDLLFLIDTTGSMGGSIDAAKEQVKSIVNDIKLAFLNEADVRIAVVGYKDHADSPNIQFLDFTESAERVRSFLTELTAIGGGDAPEDVLGGLRQALNATWKHQTRCIIHIADAPPHGRTLNDTSNGDDYPNPGSEPHGLTHEPLLTQMVGLHINYALLRINGSTDRMAFTFLKAYATASPDCKLHQSNSYYSEANTMTAIRGGGLANYNAKAGLFFEELELGTSYSALQHLVVKSVTTSASRTAVRATMSMARTRRAGTDKKLDLAAIEEDDDDVPLEAVPPQWDTPGWLNETLMVEGFSLDVVVHGPSTLNDMMAHDDNIKMSITELTIHKRSRPFAQGTLRVASYARTAASTNLFVVKSSKLAGKKLAHLAEDMRCQALCKAFALEFNALSGEAHSIDFIVTTCLKGKAGAISGADECMSLEPFIDGTYVKYNNNCGYVNEYIPDDHFNQAAQAFSHFTFERSRGCFLVSDLQGVGHVLTDPAIHTSDPERFKLADTNLGQEGFKFFFATHKCNGVCTKLGLKSGAAMLMSGSYSFRESWPSMDLTVCCSNKLCSRIVRLASTKTSDKFPGYSWCDGCWPQLRATTVKRICVWPGPHHEFKVSKFFYESQGQSTPRKCSAHREDTAVSRAAVVGGSFWARLRSATKRSPSG